MIDFESPLTFGLLIKNQLVIIAIIVIIAIVVGVIVWLIRSYNSGNPPTYEEIKRKERINNYKKYF